MVDEDRHLGNSGKDDGRLPVAIQRRTRFKLPSNSAHIPKSMRMRRVLGERISLKNRRVVCLMVSPIVSHLSTICPERKPFLLALDPQGLVRICQLHVCRVQHARIGM
jgi:hypothetical protein